ncbi:MAG: hypothetical protein HC774_06900 [Sphingomonadales bacterium]|nr:hypothetical protein [Sphingomonadales bacterium]
MSVLLWGLEPAPIAASMAIPEAGAIRRRSHSWPAAQRRTAGTVFLAREEWAKPRGRKSGPAVAAKAVEAQPVPARSAD